MKKILLALSFTTLLSACDNDEKNQLEIDAIDFSAHTSLTDLYNAEIKTMVDAKCSACHGKGLKAANTNLLFVKGNDVGNLTVLKSFIASHDNERLVNKATGRRHGGGAQIISSSREAQALTELASRIEANSP